MKSMIKELLFATIIVSVVMVVINLVSCASAPAPSETTPVVSEEPKKAPKKEYGKENETVFFFEKTDKLYRDLGWNK